MQDEFLDFLGSRAEVSAEALARVRQLVDGAADPIGRIAYSYGLLSPNCIEEILERQRGQAARFGEIAIEMGLLTAEQLEALLLIQNLRRVFAVTESLVLCGAADPRDILRHTATFIHEAAERATIGAEPA